MDGCVFGSSSQISLHTHWTFELYICDMAALGCKTASPCRLHTSVFFPACMTI